MNAKHRRSHFSVILSFNSFFSHLRDYLPGTNIKAAESTIKSYRGKIKPNGEKVRNHGTVLLFHKKPGSSPCFKILR